MKKLFYLLLLLSAVSRHANAQWITKSSLSFGPELVLPFNSSHGYDNANSYYRNGGGFNAQFELPIATQLTFTFSLGYMFYIPTNRDYAVPTAASALCDGCSVTTGDRGSDYYTYIPLVAGVRYYFAKHLYIDAESGKALKVGNAASTSYIYGGGLGGNIPLDYHNSIDLNADIERGFKSQDFDYPVRQLAIKVAYKHRF